LGAGTTPNLAYGLGSNPRTTRPKRIGMTHVAMFDVQQFDRTLLPARAGAAPGCGDRFEDAAATTAAATVLASVIHRPSAIVAALSA